MRLVRQCRAQEDSAKCHISGTKAENSELIVRTVALSINNKSGVQCEKRNEQLELSL